MKYRFFRVLAVDPEADTLALDRFLAEHAIVAVERQFVADGGNSFWAFSISYRDGGAPEKQSGERMRKPKVDYREVLDTDDFTLYAALRSLRKEISDREGVPAYALFTNEQLAAMVTGKVTSAADIAAIDGVGKTRVEKYAGSFLRVLTEQVGQQSDHGDGDAPRTD